MFHNCKLNNHINRIHERTLRIAYLAKVKMKLAPEIMNEVFDFIECQHPLRNELRFKSRDICTVTYGIETAAFVGSRI